MSLRYDAIVIGSGLGGLSAAATLARRGAKVRLLERHNQAGGYATSFFRDRFEFEVSLHALSGIGTPDNPGPLFSQLEALDVARRVSFISMDTLYKTIAPGFTLTVPAGAERFTDTLCTAFPHESDGIRQLVNQVLTVGYEVDRLRVGRYGTSPLPTLARFPNMVHAAGVSLGAVLDRYLTDPLAKLVFAQIWTYFGLPPSRLSFLMFAVGLNMHLLYGSCGIRGKAQSLSNAFVDVIRESGGEVSLNLGAQKIHIENGRVAGVETDRGERLETNVVVSNANPVSTFTRLIDKDELPSDLSKRFTALPSSISSFNVYLGLSRPSADLGMDEFEVCINQHVDVEKQYRTARELTSPGCLTVCSYDLIDKTAAPKNAGILTATALFEGSVWTRMPPETYRKEKATMAEEVMRILTRHYPKIGDAVETLSVSTPVTNLRFTGNPNGAIYGFANTPALNPGFRPPVEGPVPGLYFAGAWTQPGGGYQATVSSGINAANAAVDTLSKHTDSFLPARKDSRTPLAKPSHCGWRKLAGLRLVLEDGKSVKETILSRNKPVDPTSIRPLRPADTGRMPDAFHAERLPVTVTRKTLETEDTVTLELTPAADMLPPFFPGQYFVLHVIVNGIETSRPYSVSSAQQERRAIGLTVKRAADGHVSRYLHDAVRTGDSLFISGPYGDFYYTPIRDRSHLVAVAAGSGITPFMSMLSTFGRAAAGNENLRPEKLTLFYATRREQDRIFDERIAVLAREVSWLTVVPILSKPHRGWRGAAGHIDAAFLQEHLFPRAMSAFSYFICAPQNLGENLVNALLKMAVPRRQIRIEAFGPPSNITAQSGWPAGVKAHDVFEIKFNKTIQPLKAHAGVPLLTTMESAGIKTRALCRIGVCDACKMTIESGNVFTPEDNLQLRVDGDKRHIRPCTAFPISDLTLVE